MFDWWKPKNEVRTAEYTVRLQRRFRECVEVIYRDGSREFLFNGELVGNKWHQVNISLPKTLPDQDVQRIVPRLSAALTKLTYDYLITRVGEIEDVPLTEQEAALAGMRELGFEPQVGAQSSTLKLSKAANWKKPDTAQAKEQAQQLMRLVTAARGKRRRIEILAKSDSAIAEFL
jgi:hypothetical protein